MTRDPATAPPDDDPPNRVLFGTFTGVFTPTLLTIFGVIMYVRVGWTVGNAGLAGAWLVMLLAMGITTATGLSLSSIATNTRIGPGGPYAILSRSLGFEVGGAIGLPLYLTRPLGVAMYIIGFREGWLWIFPEHPALIVDVTVFGVLAAVSYISADLAFRVQYLIMAVIVASLISIFASPVTFQPEAPITWWGDYPGAPETGFAGADFWMVFAVFFPATTGILAGANMSGDLENPRRSIPIGTLAALAISTVVYFALAWWVARAAPPDVLVRDYNVVIDKALFPPLVLAGLLGATISSALAGLVGGPRILMAMGRHRILPFSDALARTAGDGNPRTSIVITAGLTFACICVRDLNTLAPLVTMFFLITYAMLNVVVLLEQSLGLVSYRPTLAIPRLVPFVGLVGCIFSMFIVNPTFGLFAVVLVVLAYVWIHRRTRDMRRTGVRSSVLVSVAQWAASRVTDRQQSNVRAWKPHLLVPVDDPDQVRGEFRLLLDFTRPDGSLVLLGLHADGAELRPDLRPRLVDLAESFRGEGVQASATVIRARDRVEGISVGLDALQSAFFRPNTLLLTLSPGEESGQRLTALVERIAETRVGLLFVGMHPRAGFGQRAVINLWVQRAPDTWRTKAAFDSGNLNLNLLTGYRLGRQWRATLRLMTVIADEADRGPAERFLDALCDLARMPPRTERVVLTGAFTEMLRAAPPCDVSVFGIKPDPDFAQLLTWVEATHSTCVFVRDSGRESALA